MKYRFTIAISLALLACIPAMSQKYMTKNGSIKFFSETPAESIEAHNNQVNCALDVSNGSFVFKVLIKSFEFKKALMQEHFNENYMESDKFPASTFSGTIDGIAGIDFNKNGTHKVKVTGKLTIHGVTKDVIHEGTITIDAGKVQAKSVFKVKVADYDIKIAKAVVENIAEEIEVTVDVNLSKM